MKGIFKLYIFKLVILSLTMIFLGFGVKAEVNVFALGDKSPNTVVPKIVLNKN